MDISKTVRGATWYPFGSEIKCPDLVPASRWDIHLGLKKKPPRPQPWCVFDVCFRGLSPRRHIHLGHNTNAENGPPTTHDISVWDKKIMQKSKTNKSMNSQLFLRYPLPTYGITSGSGARSPWTCIGHPQITWHYWYHLWEWSTLTMDLYWSLPDQLALSVSLVGVEHAHHGPVLTRFGFLWTQGLS
jgi:hypothetical protein